MGDGAVAALRALLQESRTGTDGAQFCRLVGGDWQGWLRPELIVILTKFYTRRATKDSIAIHRKPHTVLRRLAVQLRTVFGDAPCLKLSVYRYTYQQAQAEWQSML